MMQKAVEELVALGPLPSCATADVSNLEGHEKLLAQVRQPISDEDARALVGLFGPDDCFGLAWTLLHLVETAPGWPIQEVLSKTENDWIDRLRRRSFRHN